MLIKAPNLYKEGKGKMISREDGLVIIKLVLFYKILSVPQLIIASVVLESMQIQMDGQMDTIESF